MKYEGVVKSGLYVLITLVTLYFSPLFAGEKAPFPDNWRKFKLVEEGEIMRGNPLFPIVPGLHRTYMNDTAYSHFKRYIRTYKKEGKEPPPFPAGSMIVFVNFKDRKGKEPRMILVMYKKKGYIQTGGWVWEGFKMPGVKRIVSNPDKDCANCHYKGGKDWDGIFLSHWREK